MHHSDGRFLSGWTHGRSSTGFLRGGQEKQRGVCQSSGAPQRSETCVCAYKFIQCEDEPAIQSTAMPSTRLMPVVMTSSLHVWSRLALEIRFSPMSVQYTVSLPVSGGGGAKTKIIKTCWTWSGPPHWCVYSARWCRTHSQSCTASPCSAARSDSQEVTWHAFICSHLYSLALHWGNKRLWYVSVVDFTVLVQWWWNKDASDQRNSAMSILFEASKSLVKLSATQSEWENTDVLQLWNFIFSSLQGRCVLGRWFTSELPCKATNAQMGSYI